MKQHVALIALSAVVVVALSGCVTQTTPMSSAPPAFIYTNVAGGSYFQVPVRPIKEKYAIVKKNVVGRAESYNILGVICSFGDSTYNAAIKNALRDYPEADTLIDVHMDIKKQGILMMYNTTTLEIHGTAIKYLTSESK